MTARRKKFLILAAVLSPLLWLRVGWFSVQGTSAVYITPRFLSYPQVQIGDYDGTKGILVYIKNPTGDGWYAPPAILYEDGELWFQKPYGGKP